MDLESLLQNLFYLLLILRTTLELFLGLKNRRFMKKNINNVPEALRQSITLENHQKSIRYALTKSRFSSLKIQFDAFLLLFLFPLGFGLKIETMAKSFGFSEIYTGIIFFLIYIILTSFISLPFQIYETFIIEEKFGFNKTTPKIFIIDFIKQFILSIVLIVPLLYAVFYFFKSDPSTWWLYSWGLLTVFQFFLMWIYPSFIAPLFNKFTDLEDNDLFEKITILAKKIGFEPQGIKVMDASKRSSHGNAYFTGFGKKKKIVFFDTLLDKLNHDQILAVLAHELGHFAKNHIKKMMIFSFIFTFLGFYLLGYLSSEQFFYTGNFWKSPSSYACLFIFMNVIPLYTFILSPIGNIFSRKHEFEADHFAKENFGSEPLGQALIELQKNNHSPTTIDPLFSFFYYSHPPLLERLKALDYKEKNDLR